ncbi:MAG: magnesium/cobalt transporter CorA [Methylobacillus sp.]|jgi:magnesium transporter|nr:magnesium/cobalt transporter CorA [Methylobacillus sp.]
MRKRSRSRLHSKKVGQLPGTLHPPSEKKTSHIKLAMFRYDSQNLIETSAETLDKLDIAVRDDVLWLNVHGLHDPDLMRQIGQVFNLHPLVMEDILNTDQRPKVDDYDDYLFIVARFFGYDKTTMEISSEQVSIVLGKNFVLTFQELPTGSFDPVRERLRSGKGRLRSSNAAYLAYSLIDVIVDRYFIVLEQMDDDCDTLEDSLLRNPDGYLLKKIHLLKRETMELRRAVWPLREVINTLMRNESGLFEHETVLHLRDVYDHTVHFIESLEALRDMLSGMLDIYFSTLSNRINMEVRALTVVAMMFMPATLIAGIFGMNFEVMPWLKDHSGFWFAIALMGGIATLMTLVFWRRQWLSRKTA